MALGYSNTRDALSKHVDAEDKGTVAIRDHVDSEDKGVNEMVTPGGNQKVIFINESGLYALILSSKLPQAQAFKRWVTSEVLPEVLRMRSERPIIINSGYRSPQLNKKIGGVAGSNHILLESP